MHFYLRNEKESIDITAKAAVQFVRMEYQQHPRLAPTCKLGLIKSAQKALTHTCPQIGNQRMLRCDREHEKSYYNTRIHFFASKKKIPDYFSGVH
jgi:predicted RNA-binding Zn-ribbon protein involved in translation (DUF1610 family)